LVQCWRLPSFDGLLPQGGQSAWERKRRYATVIPTKPIIIVRAPRAKATQDVHDYRNAAHDAQRADAADRRDVSSFRYRAAAEAPQARSYLDIHELMPVGVLQNVFDNSVGRSDWWHAELDQAYRQAANRRRYGRWPHELMVQVYSRS
jgi:hypothetical protein